MCQEFHRTKFLTVVVGKTLNRAIQLGMGKCSGVRLKLNAYVRNSTTLQSSAANLPFYAYYGDAQKADAELVASDGTGNVKSDGWSPVIYCQDLSEVFVRYAGTTANANWPATAHIQVMVFDPEGEVKAGGCGK